MSAKIKKSLELTVETSASDLGKDNTYWVKSRVFLNDIEIWDSPSRNHSRFKEISLAEHQNDAIKLFCYELAQKLSKNE